LCPPEFTRKPWQRRALHLEYLLSELLYPIARRTLPYRPKMWWIPRLPMWLHPTRRPHTIPWTANIPPPPDVLRTVPGIGLIPDLQEQAFQREPLHDFTRLHPGMRSISSPTGRMWMSMLSTAPRIQSAARRRARFNTEVMPAEARTIHNAEELTGAMRREADRLGFAAVGVTHYDVRYHFAEYHGLNVGDTIVVGIEVDYPHQDTNWPNSLAYLEKSPSISPTKSSSRSSVGTPSKCWAYPSVSNEASPRTANVY
jgi:epoxyqueuosine reductase